MRSFKNVYQKLYPGINTRITVPFLVAIIVVAAIGAFIITQLVASNIQERINNQLLDSAQAGSNAIADIEAQQLATLRQLAFTEGMAEAMATDDIETLDTLITPVAANVKIDAVIVFDAQGQGLFMLERELSVAGIVYNRPTPPAIQSWASVQRVLTLEADRLGDKAFEVIGEAPNVILYISAPVIDSDGNLVGGISIGISASNFVFQVSQQAVSEVTFYDSTGIILGTTIRQVPPETLQLTPIELEAIQSEVKERSPIIEKTIGVSDYQTMYVPLKLRNQQIGLMAVALRSSFIVERVGTSRNALITLFGGLFISVGLIGILVARSINRPITKLVDTTRAIREGDLTKRVDLDSPDELGELGLSFDHMTDELIKRNQEISQLYTLQLEETARRQAVLTSIQDAVIVIDRNRTMILSNTAAETLMAQISPREEDVKKLYQLADQLEHLTQAQTISLLNRHFSVSATPVMMPSSALLGHVIVFHDITSLIEAERLKDEMILQLSHELRTPLTAAKGYLDLVRMFEYERSSAQGKDFMDKTVIQLGVLVRMINQVVDVSTAIAGKFTMNYHPFNLTETVLQVIEEQRLYIENRRLRLALLLPDNPININGDREKIAQVIENLIRNAYSYTLPGGWLEIGLEAHPNKVAITVADNGVGIEADEIDKVFERMYRGRSAQAGPTDTRGLGLGLYISKQIVEAHKGIINIDSIPNSLTIVTVELPLK